jgi:hypothetical protein
MSNTIFVIFSGTSDRNGLFEDALGPLWEAFGRKEFVLYVSVTEKGFQQPANRWDLALIWEPQPTGQYNDETNVPTIKSRLQYLSTVPNDLRCIGVMQHRQSSNLHKKQKEIIQDLLSSGSSKPHYTPYTHEEEDPIYKAVADVLQAAGTPTYQTALRKLFFLICSPYDLAIDILMDFLPADLEWQITSPEEAQESLPQRDKVESKYERFRQLVRERDATADFTEANELFAHIFQCLPNNLFHETYKKLRDALLVTVEAVEQTAGGTRA